MTGVLEPKKMKCSSPHLPSMTHLPSSSQLSLNVEPPCCLPYTILLQCTGDGSHWHGAHREGWCMVGSLTDGEDKMLSACNPHCGRPPGQTMSTSCGAAPVLRMVWLTSHHQGSGSTLDLPLTTEKEATNTCLWNKCTWETGLVGTHSPTWEL